MTGHKEPLYLGVIGGGKVAPEIAALAREVKTLSGGRLGVRSLRDPEVRALLDRARPGEIIAQLVGLVTKVMGLGRPRNRVGQVTFGIAAERSPPAWAQEAR